MLSDIRRPLDRSALFGGEPAGEEVGAGGTQLLRLETSGNHPLGIALGLESMRSNIIFLVELKDSRGGHRA